MSRPTPVDDIIKYIHGKHVFKTCFVPEKRIVEHREVTVADDFAVVVVEDWPMAEGWSRVLDSPEPLAEAKRFQRKTRWDWRKRRVKCWLEFERRRFRLARCTDSTLPSTRSIRGRTSLRTEGK